MKIISVKISFVLIAMTILSQCTPNKKTVAVTSHIPDTIASSLATVALESKVEKPPKPAPPYDRSRFKTAIINSKGGYRECNTPNESDTLGTVVLPQFKPIFIHDTIHIDTTIWYEVIHRPWSTTTYYKRYVSSKAVYYEPETPVHIIRNRLLIKEYPHLGIRNSDKGMQIKLRSGEYILVPNVEAPSFVGFNDKLNVYMFNAYFDCGLCTFMCNYDTGERTEFGGTVKVNNAGTSLFCRKNIEEDGNISLFSMADSAIKEVCTIKLCEGYGDAQWINDSTISMPYYSQTGKDKFTSTISRNNQQWSIYPSTEMLTETAILLGAMQQFTQEYLKEKSFYDNRPDRVHNDFISGTIMNLILADWNVESQIDGEKLLAFFNKAVVLDKLEFFSMAEYYAIYHEKMRKYMKIYKVMLDNIGKDELLRVFEQAAQNEDKDYVRRFYREFMLQYNIDLEANMLHETANSTTIGFWLRRLHDGSAEACYQVGNELLEKYDAAFYHRYFVEDGIKEEALSTFSKAYYRDFSTSVVTEVTVSDRRLDEYAWIEYRIMHDSAEWVSAENISFQTPVIE